MATALHDKASPSIRPHFPIFQMVTFCPPTGATHSRQKTTKSAKSCKRARAQKPRVGADSLKLKLERRIIMKKIYGIVTLAAMLIGATLLLERTIKVAAAAPTGIKNVVLVHGAFADGSGWEAVAKILEKDGYTVSVA